MGEERGSCPGCDERDARFATLEACNRAQAARISELEDRLRSLEARLKQNSSNSSRPPSSDILTKGKPKTPPSGRKPGGQPGHEPHNRPMFPPDKVDFTVDVLPRKCRGCAHDLLAPPPGADPGDVRRHQVAEIPEQSAFITEYRCHALTCPDCGEVTRAELPADVPEGCADARLQAAYAVLTGRYHLSRRDAGEIAALLFGEKAAVSDGAIMDMEARTSEALKPCFEEALDHVRNAPVANADETGWRVRAKRAWLWVAATAMIAVYKIHPSRSRKAFDEFIGAFFKGVLITDRYAVYARHALHLRQICWAHLKRDFQALVDRAGPAKPVGEWGLRAISRMFGVWRDFKAGTLDRLGLGLKTLQTKADFGRLLATGLDCADRKASRFCADLRTLWDALWKFAESEGVDPTNNRAERSLRHSVLWRKGSFGCWSEDGARFVERILTVVQSLRMQGQPALAFVEATIRASRTGAPLPSLIPGQESVKWATTTPAQAALPA